MEENPPAGGPPKEDLVLDPDPLRASLSVVLPMYNEEECIRQSVLWTERAIEQITKDYEIIVVNDGSTDSSPGIVAALSRRNPRIRLLNHQKNLRLGMTLRTGFTHAVKDLVFYCDSDLPVDLVEVGRAIRIMAFTQADMVSAYRFDRTAEGVLRAVYSFIYNHLIRVLFPIRVKDVNFSFKLFRHRVLQAFELESTGSFIDAEMLLKCKLAGFRIVQFGVDYFPRTRGTSTLSSLSVILQLVCDMLRYRIKLWRGRTGLRHERSR